MVTVIEVVGLGSSRYSSTAGYGGINTHARVLWLEWVDA